MILGAGAVFGGPALLDFLRNLGVLLGIPAPHLEWPQMVFCDALLAYRGDPLYANPALHPTSITYNPGFPYAVGALLHLKQWTGWGLLVNQLSILALASLIGFSAAGRCRPAPRGWLRVLMAMALGALGLRLMTHVAQHAHLLYQARADHLAWLLALAGYGALFGMRGPWRRRCWVSALLLGAGFWTKQTTVVLVPAAAVAWLWLGEGPRWRRLAQWSGIIVGGSLVLWAALERVSGGWYTELVWVRPLRELPQVATFWAAFEGFFTRSGTAIALAGVALAAAWPSRGAKSSGAGQVARGEEKGDRLLPALAVALLLAVLGACQLSRGLGADLNQFIGAGWLLGWVVSVAVARAAERREVFFGAGLLAVASFWAPAGHNLRPTELPPSQYYDESGTLGLLGQAPVFHYHYCGANRPGDPVIPNANNLMALKSFDLVPMWLVDKFIDGEFRSVTAFAPQTAYRDSFASHGVLDQDFFSRLDAVIERRYEARGGAPMLERREPFPKDSWERTCFMPPLRTLDGSLFRQRLGMGFWCAETPDPARAVFRPLPKAEREYAEICADPVREIRAAELVLQAPGGGPVSFAIKVRQGIRSWLYAHVAEPLQKPLEPGSWLGPGFEIQRPILLPAVEGKVRLRIQKSPGGALLMDEAGKGTTGAMDLPAPGPQSAPVQLCLAGVRGQPLEVRVNLWDFIR